MRDFCCLFHFYRLLRAHFLTTEAADAFPVVVYRRLVPAFLEVHGFSGDRAAFDTDAAADTARLINVRFLLE